MNFSLFVLIFKHKYIFLKHKKKKKMVCGLVSLDD